MKSLFEGIGVAIVTPFKNNKVDYDALRTLIHGHIKSGVKAIVLLGTTGEGSTLTQYERKTIIEFAKQEICNKTKLIVGTRIGTTASIVPLVIAAIPFIARMIESSLTEVDRGIIED